MERTLPMVLLTAMVSGLFVAMNETTMRQEDAVSIKT